jgi:hypothetical protein
VRHSALLKPGSYTRIAAEIPNGRKATTPATPAGERRKEVGLRADEKLLIAGNPRPLIRQSHEPLLGSRHD